jgi:O-antigen/teichoic acid export membrane protein
LRPLNDKDLLKLLSNGPTLTQLIERIRQEYKKDMPSGEVGKALVALENKGYAFLDGRRWWRTPEGITFLDKGLRPDRPFSEQSTDQEVQGGTKERVVVGRGAASLYLANIASLLMNTAYFIVLTNYLGSALEVGVVTALNILIWFLVTVCIFAQPIVIPSAIPAPLAVLKFIPELLAKDDHKGATKVFRASTIASIVLALGVAGFVFVLPSLVIPLLGGQAVLPGFIQLSAIEIVIISVSQICLGAVIAMGDTGAGTRYIIVWSITRYTLASVLLFLYGVIGVLIGWIVGDLGLLLLALQKCIRRLNIRTGASSFSVKALARYSIFTLFAAMIGFVVNQADRLFTLSQQGLSRLAIYNVAITASNVVSYAPYALLTVLLPAVVALFVSDRIEELHAMIRSYTRYVSLVVMPISFGLASVMEIPLRIFGADYVAGTAPAVIIAVASGLTAFGTVYAGALLALEKMRWYTAANILGVTGLFLVGATLTPALGLNGPALGRACLLVITTIVYSVATIRNGIFEIDLKAYFVAVGGSAIMSLAVYGLLSVVQSFVLKIAMLPVLAVIGLLVYVVVLRVSRLLTVDDIDFIRDLVPNRLRGIIPAMARLAGLKYSLEKSG